MANLKDILLDENNMDDLEFTTPAGTLRFEQLATILLDGDVFAVLHPLDEMAGVEDDEAIVYRLKETPEESSLVMEEDEDVAIRVFDMYRSLQDDAQ